MNQPSFRAAVLALLLAPVTSVCAADAIVARSLAATCANCHGTNGNSASEAVAPLAGKSKREILATMNAFKLGKKPATVMHQIAKGYTDAQLEIIADFFSAQKR